jgi:hypothetical protein
MSLPSRDGSGMIQDHQGILQKGIDDQVVPEFRNQLIEHEVLLRPQLVPGKGEAPYIAVYGYLIQNTVKDRHLVIHLGFYLFQGSGADILQVSDNDIPGIKIDGHTEQSRYKQDDQIRKKPALQ